MFDVITLGAAVQDVFVTSKEFQLITDDSFETGVGECFSLGSKIAVDNIVFDTGGGATNAAVTFRRSGMKVACVTRLGKDLGGEFVLRALKKEKIDLRFVSQYPKETTGYSVVLSTGKGDRTILTYRGASQKFTGRDIQLSELKTKWLYISSLAGNTTLVEKIVQYANRKRISVAYNPGSAELAKGRAFFARLIPKLQVFNLNMEEAAALLGLDPVEKMRVFKELCLISKNIVVITDGVKGAYCDYFGKKFFIPTTKKTVVNTTGAGDAFGSGFVAGLMLSDDPYYALRLALYNSENVVQKVGAKNGIFTTVPQKLHQRIIAL